MKKLISTGISILVVLISTPFSARAWEGKTHSGITKYAVSQPPKILDTYLRNAGIPSGDQAPFSLSEDFYWPEDFRERVEDGDIKSKPRPALDWLVDASADEDSPMIRASHHFHDPTTGEGWDEQGACLAVLAYLEYKGYKTAGEWGLLTGPVAIALADIIAKGNFTHGK